MKQLISALVPSQHVAITLICGSGTYSHRDLIRTALAGVTREHSRKRKQGNSARILEASVRPPATSRISINVNRRVYVRRLHHKPPHAAYYLPASENSKQTKAANEADLPRGYTTQRRVNWLWVEYATRLSRICLAIFVADSVYCHIVG